MKNLLKDIKNSFFAVLAIVLFIEFDVLSAIALEKANIQSVQGEVYILYNNTEKLAQPGDIVYDMSEIITKSGSKVNFIDKDQHQYELIAQSHIKFFNKIIELKVGNMWLQSINEREKFYIVTANGKVTYERGIGVISYNVDNGKTQLLVIEGNFFLANSTLNHTDIRINPGEFSYVDPAYDNGTPRKGTNVGAESYEKLLSLFDQAQALPLSDKAPDSNSKTLPKESLRQGKIYFIEAKKQEEANNLNSQAQNLLLEDIKHQTKPKIAPKATENDQVFEASNVNLEIYGLPTKSSASNKRSTPPDGNIDNQQLNVNNFTKREKLSSNHRSSGVSRATVIANPPVAAKEKEKELETINASTVDSYGDQQNKTDLFEKSLEKEYLKQLRHPSETNALIDNLKSFEADYDKKH